MAYKNGGIKATYTDEDGNFSHTYTIYCALESVSDYDSYIMIDENGERTPICISEEDNCAHGGNSLIDVLYYLKHATVGTYFAESYSDSIVIEEMTYEEMNKYFRNR